jgi:hypothetical protein
MAGQQVNARRMTARAEQTSRVARARGSSMRRESYTFTEALRVFCPEEWTTLQVLRTETPEQTKKIGEWEQAEHFARAFGAVVGGGGPSAFLDARSAAGEGFRSLLRKGTAMANGIDSNLPVSVGPVDIPPRAWDDLTLDISLECAIGRVSVLTSLRFTLAGTRRSLARIATERWVRDLVESGIQPSTKEQAMRDAQAGLGIDFSRVAFCEAWRKWAPSRWTKPGRPSKNPQRKIHSRKEIVRDSPIE